MNWYKLSQNQQQLMFYPFGMKPRGEGVFKYYPEKELLQKEEPISYDSDGNPLYKCARCGKTISEDNISIWEDSYNQKYKLPLNIQQNIDNLFQEIKNYLDPIIVESENQKRETQKDTLWALIPNDKIPTPGLPIIYQKYQDVVEDILSMTNYNSFIKFVKQDSLDPINLNQLYRYVSDPAYIEKIKSNITSVPVLSPVCKECQSPIECEFCGKHIEKMEDVVTDRHGTVACRKCIEDGQADFCSECGTLHFHDELRPTDDGYICENCIEKMGYDVFESDIEETERDDSFDHWLNENRRIFIPYAQDYSDLEQRDFLLIEFLKTQGCDVSPEDYRKGICHKDKRTYRIGKLLTNLRRKELKENPEKADIIEEKYRSYFNVLETSTYRKTKEDTDLVVMISGNKHDIGMMSTGQNWTSCKHCGQDLTDVIREVENGGLVAYLLRKEDIPEGDDVLEEKSALGRISIKRFENDEGYSIAVPEGRIYGNTPANFYDIVNDWLKAKQKDAPKGTYHRKGMNYSDTLGPSRKISQIIKRLIKLGYNKDIQLRNVFFKMS